jgi:hypothetical protein
VAPYKKIREVQFIREMPKAPTGKTLEGCLEIKSGVYSWEEPCSVLCNAILILTWPQAGARLKLQ